jgi:hypothetical protein
VVRLRHEVDEIREHIGVQARDIVLLDNGLRWIQSDLPDVDFKKMTVEWAGKKGWGKA